MLLSSFTCLFLQLRFITLCFALFITIRRHVVLIAKCLATLQPSNSFKLPIESLKSPLSNDITCLHTDCFESKAWSQWFVVKQFMDANKIRDFFTMNSEFRIRFHELKWSSNFVFANFYEFVHTNFVFVCKTSKFVRTNSWGFSACYVANDLYCNKPFSFMRMHCDWSKMSVAMRLQMIWITW